MGRSLTPPDRTPYRKKGTTGSRGGPLLTPIYAFREQNSRDYHWGMIVHDRVS
jgi:hypothetical protein